MDYQMLLLTHLLNKKKNHIKMKEETKDKFVNKKTQKNDESNNIESELDEV